MSDELDAWMAFLLTSDCPCQYQYKSLGRLYGVSCGNGWVRMSTDPACPHHGDNRPPVRIPGR